jgi:SAM-dependent methyltransferase
LVQLADVVPPELMFKHYLYVSSTTKTFRDHFTRMADDLTSLLGLGKDSLAVDIGSNDGLLLKGFAAHGVKVCGVEPAENIAKLAREAGVETINAFFDAACVEQIRGKFGPASVVTANNVFAHIHDIRGVANDVKALLADRGVFVIEAAYLFDMIEQLTFDSVYHEHVSYYSVRALVGFFDRVGMEVIRVDHVPTHGGSLRVFAQKKGAGRPVEATVGEFLAREKSAGVDSFATYEAFGKKIEGVRTRLRDFFATAKKEGKSVAGFGMPAKATTLLTFCRATKDDLKYVVDDNPLKQGRFVPVSHIPIVGAEALDRDRPDYLVILAWNFATEITQKLAPYREKGVRFVIPLPEPRIV